MLTQVQEQFPQESAMFSAIGDALYAGQQYGEAVQAFALAVRFDPASSGDEASLSTALAALGQKRVAEQHLERAMTLDPLNLSAATRLINLYIQDGEPATANELSDRVAETIQTGTQHADDK